MSKTSTQERLSLPPDELVQELWGDPHIRADLLALPLHIAAHRAQAAMLLEQGIVDREDIVKILKALDTIEEQKGSVIPIRPELNDLTTCTESYLIDVLGEETGGRLHTGRSRNDLFMALSRLAVRDRLLVLYGAMLAFRRTLLVRAAEHVDTLFPGYTHHSQQAQPITFAHFVLAHHDVFARDGERLRAAFRETNQSPLGGAALAGTGFPVNRERLAELLGFDGLIENTADACGSRDYELQAGSSVAILCSGLGRLAESLILYTSAEFGYVELDDACASVSSIMPQKKNPVSLEMVEALCARVVGRLSAMFTILKSTTLGMSRETGYVDGELDAVFSDATNAVRLCDRAIQGLNVDVKRSLNSVSSGMSTTTELADMLVRHKGLSFRQAHRVVGRAVARALAEQKPLDSTLVNVVAEEVLGHSLAVDDQFLQTALDARTQVEARATRGGPAPKETRRMLTERENALRIDSDWLKEQRRALSAADRLLGTTVHNILETEDRR